MFSIFEWIFIVLVCSWTAFMGYKIAYVEENNYTELFMAYIRENNRLEQEVTYWKDCYNSLYNSIQEDMVEDEVINSRGDVIGVILKK